MKTSHMLLGMAAAGLLALGMGVPMAAAQSGSKPAEKAEAAKPAAKDIIVFKTGKQVECEIVEETDTTVKVKVSIAGMSAETVYQKSEILTIQKGAGAPLDGSAKPITTKGSTKPDAKKDVKSEDGAPTVYVVRCTGEFGRDVCATSISRVIEDAKKHQPDVLVMEFNHTFEELDARGRPKFLYDPGSFDQLETSRQISTLITDQIRDDAGWKKKPRLVGYIKRALGAASFLPFICPEIYFAPDALHGGVGGLDHMFDGVGDEVVQEKQYSLRQKRAEGLAEKGGHEPRILRAMARVDYVLSYRLVGGKPEFLERMPEAADEFLLTDNGEEDRGDSIQDLIRYKGDDVLTLNAVTAERIGFSKGTVTDLRELMYALGFTRDFVEVKGRGDDIIKGWGEEVTKGEANLRRLGDQYNNVEVRAPGQYRERTAARTQQKSVLREMRSIFNRYRESLDPRRIPQLNVQQIDGLIDRIDQQQRLDGPP